MITKSIEAKAIEIIRGAAEDADLYLCIVSEERGVEMLSTGIRANATAMADLEARRSLFVQVMIDALKEGESSSEEPAPQPPRKRRAGPPKP